MVTENNITKPHRISMDIFYFVYANPHGDLKSLEREREEHYKRLMPQFLSANYSFFQYPGLTQEGLSQAMEDLLDKVTIFHFSGHAGQQELVLQDGSSYVTGMTRQLAALLSANPIPALTLVFLNGCSTIGMVQDFLHAGVPIVIATSGSVNDRTATNFSIDFYRALTRGESIQGAFQFAEDKLLTVNNELRIYQNEEVPKGQTDDPLWGIFTQSNKRELLNWKIRSLRIPTGLIHRYEPNELLRAAIYKILLKAGLSDFVSLERSRIEGKDVEEKINANLLLGFPGLVSYAISNLLKGAMNEDDDDRETLLKKQFFNLYRVFQSLTETLFLIALSQFWDICLDSEGEPALPMQASLIPDELNAIRSFLTTERKTRNKSFDYIHAFLAIGNILSKAGPTFSTELDTLRNALIADPELRASCDFFNQTRDQLAGGYLGNAIQLELKCSDSERHLSFIFDRLSFLAAYDFGVLKIVEFQLPRYSKQHFYRYRLSKLPKHGNSTYRLASPRTNSFTSMQSVVMLKSDCFNEGEQVFDDIGQVNFYPFLLDHLISDPEAEKGDLIIYSHYHRPTKSLFYEGAYKERSDRAIPVYKTENSHLLLTFNTFINVLFGKDLETLN